MVEAEERLGLIVNEMERLNLNYLVAYFNGIHSFLEANYVFLLSDFKSVGESMAILNREGKITLMTTPSWDGVRARFRTIVDRVVATDHLLDTFQEFLLSVKPDPNQIGFIGLDTINKFYFSELSVYLNGCVKQVDSYLTDALATKSKKELARAKKAVEIAEQGYQKMLEVARPGIYEYELAAEVDHYVRALGADDNFMLMSASQHNQAVRPPGRRILEAGDIILAEISPSYEGQFIQICRTVVLGDAHKEVLTEKYNLLVEATKKGMEAAKPGVKMSEVYQAINQVIQERGYGAYCAPPYMRVRGHSLGLSSLQPGDVSKDNNTVLKENMLFIIHPNQYIPETGYLLCGETVVLTSKGAEPLTSRPLQLDFIPV
jgi:Xaa-Pro aminopeptidase